MVNKKDLMERSFFANKNIQRQPIYFNSPHSYMDFNVFYFIALKKRFISLLL
jgi:hypothetical protein